MDKLAAAIASILLSFLLIAPSAAASRKLRPQDHRNLLANALASTPPMGWNSWNHFRCGINETVVKQNDDCWAELTRDVEAPLLLGNDLREISEDSMEIIWNSEVISVNQNPLGVQAKKVRSGHVEEQIWAGPLSGYRVAVLLVNRRKWRMAGRAYWDDIGIPNDTVVQARDLWELFVGNISHTSGAHSCQMSILTPIS
ncbi:alpha-galactosidase 1-like [Cucurbita maxima]|uniref:alpha-galactosidase n=1 Tax=Cucurbita maxima TaxID=3661 RepID=A0A6J1HQS0_CUCMA|nr:alpha-galactosidase 1-like [Cucurbita maxima]